MNPIQPQIQNLNDPTIYSSFANVSYNSQLDSILNISSNVNAVQGIPVVLDNTMSQVSISTTNEINRYRLHTLIST